MSDEPEAMEDIDFFDQVGVPVIKGDMDEVPRAVKDFIAQNVSITVYVILTPGTPNKVDSHLFLPYNYIVVSFLSSPLSSFLSFFS